jgi:hypothetical protein
MVSDHSRKCTARFRDPRGNVSALHHHHDREQLPIDAATLPPHWQGERMDLGLAGAGVAEAGRAAESGAEPLKTWFLDQGLLLYCRGNIIYTRTK